MMTAARDHGNANGQPPWKKCDLCFFEGDEEGIVSGPLQSNILSLQKIEYFTVEVTSAFYHFYLSYPIHTSQSLIAHPIPDLRISIYFVSRLQTDTKDRISPLEELSKSAFLVDAVD